MKGTVLIDCPDCGKRVEATLARDWLDHQYEYRLGLAQCGNCYRPLVAFQDFLGPVGPHDEEIYSDAQRVWPSPEVTLSAHIPDVIRASLDEARKCLSCGTYTASVAMTGRGIEGLCSHFKTKRTELFAGLKELVEREIIDKRLYHWADELRQHRNLAAHVSGATFSREDAQDIFDFALAICEYVFILNYRFEQFIRRSRKKRGAGRKSGGRDKGQPEISP